MMEFWGLGSTTLVRMLSFAPGAKIKK
jgi:hypothetical protein